MRNIDTSMGGATGSFPDTSWSLISRLGRSQTAESQKTLESLCRNYWKPLYLYLRARTRSNEDAKDLVQAFLLWLMEGEALKKFAPERGGFRHYLKMLLKQFAFHQDEAMNRLKRGGAAGFVPLDIVEPAAPSAPPDESFDKAWRDQLMGQAIDGVRKRYQEEGREAQFRIFEEYDLKDSKLSYGELGAQLGLNDHAVRNALSAVRESVRTELRAELARLTSGPDELELEWRELLG